MLLAANDRFDVAAYDFLLDGEIGRVSRLITHTYAGARIIMKPLPEKPRAL